MADGGLIDDAVRIAGHAGRAYLEAEGKPYDRERSAGYLEDNFPGDDDDTVISAAIDKAFDKIDGGSHVAGARIAVSVADEYIDGFAPPGYDNA